MDENTRIEVLKTCERPLKARRPALIPLKKERITFFAESQVIQGLSEDELTIIRMEKMENNHATNTFRMKHKEIFGRHTLMHPNFKYLQEY